MDRLKSTLSNMVLSLGAITIVAAALLGGIYAVTKDVIAQADEKAQIEAIKEVAPAFDNNPIEDKYLYTVNAGQKDSLLIAVFPAIKAGKVVGAAVEGVTMKGFSGEIRVMFGFDEDGTIRGFRVLKHSETAGLGAKMQEWFGQGNRIIGHNPQTDNMTVKKDGGNIDGITAATISSRAFLDALNEAYAAYKDMRDKNVGGTNHE